MDKYEVNFIKCKNVNEIVNSLLKLKIQFEKNEKIKVKNIGVVSPVKEIQWKGWSFDSQALSNTIKYCVEKLALQSEIHIVYEGRLHTIIYIRPKYTAKEYLKFLRNLNPKLKWPHTIYNKQVKMYIDKNAYKYPKYRFMSCIVKSLQAKGQGDDENVITFMGKKLRDASLYRPLPDGVYFCSATDILTLRKDGNEPWVNVVGGKKKLFSHSYKKFVPILNLHSHIDYLDIPLPTFDDFKLMYNLSERTESFETNWNKKISQAVFRGSGTGCGFTVKSNPRFKAAYLSQLFPELLNAGIVNMTSTLKIHEVEGVGYNTFETVGIKPVNKIPFDDQTKYKYILHLDGNVAAYRLSETLMSGSCILLQESGSRMWFQHLMKPYEHYIPVKDDLSDLIEQIQWCIKNDDICYEISRNSLMLGQSILKEKVFLDYIVDTLESLHT